MTIEAMKQALEALEYIHTETSVDEDELIHLAITALRAAIEQAQEPVAWVGPSWLHPETRTWESESFAPGPIDGWIPLYTAPRQWQGLTGEAFTTYSSKLKCCFHGWRVLADGEIALDMPESHCCDMSGAIEIAEVIMPSVWKIITFSGGVPDVAYILCNGKWEVCDLRAAKLGKGES